MKKIFAHGPVILEDGKLLVTKDTKDPFYKIPGGRVEGEESGEETALREFEEETGLKAKIIRVLSTMVLDKNPKTNEPMRIELYHYLARLVKPLATHNDYSYNGHEVCWLPVVEIRDGKHYVAPNILFLVENGEI